MPFENCHCVIQYAIQQPPNKGLFVIQMECHDDVGDKQQDNIKIKLPDVSMSKEHFASFFFLFQVRRGGQIKIT